MPIANVLQEIRNRQDFVDYLLSMPEDLRRIKNAHLTLSGINVTRTNGTFFVFTLLFFWTMLTFSVV